jgi:hypothetical protein
LKTIAEGPEPTTQQPPCAYGPCYAAHLMHYELSVYIAMFWFLKCDLYQGSVPYFMRRAKATDVDFDVMKRLTGVYNDWLERQRDQS